MEKDPPLQMCVFDTLMGIDTFHLLPNLNNHGAKDIEDFLSTVVDFRCCCCC